MASDLKAAVRAVDWTDPETGVRTSDVEAIEDGEDTAIRGLIYDDKWRHAGRFRFRLVGKTVELEQVSMKPEHRGKGWASRWLEHMERGFAAMGMENFEMHPTGDAGYGFVAANGFRKQPGEHPHRTTITLTELWRRPIEARSEAGSVRSST